MCLKKQKLWDAGEKGKGGTQVAHKIERSKIFCAGNLGGFLFTFSPSLGPAVFVF